MAPTILVWSLPFVDDVSIRYGLGFHPWDELVRCCCMIVTNNRQCAENDTHLCMASGGEHEIGAVGASPNIIVHLGASEQITRNASIPFSQFDN